MTFTPKSQFSINNHLRLQAVSDDLGCRNQQCCLHFWLLLEDPFEQLSGIVKNVDRHGKPALFLIMPDSCLRIIQAKTKAVRRRKSVNNATISYTSASLGCRISSSQTHSILGNRSSCCPSTSSLTIRFTSITPAAAGIPMCLS